VRFIGFNLPFGTSSPIHRLQKKKRGNDMAEREKHDYRNEVHATVETSCHMGQELHIITSNAFKDRVMNIRLNRVIPSQTGHVGYTRVGFFLTKKEARQMRDALSEVIEKDSAWDLDAPEPIIDMEGLDD
tara:strand:- start:38 stop:427 length:390 start_codon:yes stop_codon:yes gene_type:complete